MCHVVRKSRAVGGRGFIDVAGDRRRTDERDRIDLWVDEQRIHGVLVALDDAKDAFGKPGFGQ